MDDPHFSHHIININENDSNYTLNKVDAKIKINDERKRKRTERKI